MATTARRCAGCGGPLPQTPPAQRQLTCPFCGVVNDLTDAQPATTEITINVGDVAKLAPGLGRKIRFAILAGLLVAAAVVAFAVLRVVRPVTDALKDVDRQARAMQERARPIEPVELATLADAGWKDVKTAPPPSGWPAFDPVANVGWATAIARAWQADARLHRIDVTRVSPAGTLDLSADGEHHAGYRFVSPAKIAEWDRIADRETNARVPFELMLNVTQQKVAANVVRGRPPRRALPPDTLDTKPLGTVIATAIKTGRFAEFPFYNGYLTYLDREGWVWYLQSLSQRDSLPRVRARDGQPYPYPR